MSKKAHKEQPGCYSLVNAAFDQDDDQGWPVDYTPRFLGSKEEKDGTVTLALENVLKGFVPRP